MIPNLGNKLDFSHIIPIIGYNHYQPKADEELVHLESYLTDQLLSTTSIHERAELQERTFRLRQIHQYVQENQNGSTAQTLAIRLLENKQSPNNPEDASPNILSSSPSFSNCIQIPNLENRKASCDRHCFSDPAKQLG